MFILKCHYVQNISQNLLERAETRVFPIISKGVLFPSYTVSVSYYLLYMNQVPEDCYMYTWRIKQKFNLHIIIVHLPKVIYFYHFNLLLAQFFLLLALYEVKQKIHIWNTSTCTSLIIYYRRGRNLMVVRCTTTYAIGAYHR